MPPYVFKPKTENENTLYITPYVNVTLCIKTKNRKQKHNTGLYHKNRIKCNSSQAQTKINNQNQNSLFLFERIYSVCQLLYFYNLPFEFIHYTFFFNSISMGFCRSSTALNMKLSESKSFL